MGLLPTDLGGQSVYRRVSTWLHVMGHTHAPEASLRLARGGIAIHKIQGVSFTYKSDPVRHEPWSEGARHFGIR